MSAASGKWNREHPEQIREATRKWQLAHPEAVREWQLAHPEQMRENRRAWHLAHLEQGYEATRKWKQAHPEQVREIQREWCQAHPEQCVANNHRRLARIAGAGGSYTVVEWEMLCEKYGGRCLCCGERKPLTVDHIVPISCGGMNVIDNIQPLCKSCNSSKYMQTIDYRGVEGMAA